MKQLRLTTSPPGFMGMSGDPVKVPETPGEIIQITEQKAKGAYLHGEIETKAGYDIPIFIDGDMNQLNLPVEEQDILVLLPDGDYKCKATIEQDLIEKAYYITMFDDNESITQP